MYKVVLIGSGQLGSRYLQGLVDAKSKLSITVVDTLAESLVNARLRWIEVGGDSSFHQVHFLKHIPSDLPEIDLVLLATSSLNRADLVKSIADSSNVRFWVIEKVLAQSSTEVLSIQSATSAYSCSWVNIPRRMMKWHQSLRKCFLGHAPVSVSFSGGGWGLACNSIHFLDLVAWWTGESLVSVDCKDLDDNWHVTKRIGYYDITGSLKATFSGGSLLYLSSKDTASNEQLLQVELNNGVVWEINENSGLASCTDGQRIGGRIEYQSQLSGSLVDNILQDNK